MEDSEEATQDGDWELAGEPAQVTRLESVGTMWAYIAHYPAEKTEAGSLVPPSETMIRVTTPQHGTVTLVSALREEIDFMRSLAIAFSRATNLRVTLRRLQGAPELDEEEIVDGRARSLNRITLPLGRPHVV